MPIALFSLCRELLPEGVAAPEWIELLPAGPEIKGRDGRDWRLSNPQRVIDAFTQGGVFLPIDIEHATEIKAPAGEPAPAMAWITELALRSGALCARVAWNEEGESLVAGRKYRYHSPAFNFEKTSREIVRFTSVGLTNKPNLDLAALCSMWTTEEKDRLPDSSFLYIAPGGTKDSEDKTTPRSLRHFPVRDEHDHVDLDHVRDALSRIPDSDVPADEKERATAEARRLLASHGGNNHEGNSNMKLISKALGLVETATEGEVLTAVNQLQQRATTPPLDKFVPRADYDTALNRATTAETQLRALTEKQNSEQIEALIKQGLESGRVTPATADYHRAQCRQEGGIDRFKEFVAKAPVIAGLSGLEGKRPGETPAGDGLDLTEAERAICRNMGMDPKVYAKSEFRQKATK